MSTNAPHTKLERYSRSAPGDWMADPTVTKTGPESYTTGYLNSYHLPVYKSTYENVVGTNPQWQWIEGMLPMVEAS